MPPTTARGPHDAARMYRILAACDAPPEVAASFRRLCSHWQKGDAETAEQLLLSACLEHNFARPWEAPGRDVALRPYRIGRTALGFAGDRSATAAEEQSYRRGFSQGGARVLQMLDAGRTLADVRGYLEDVQAWRVQPVQSLHAEPGSLHPQALPSRWDGI